MNEVEPRHRFLAGSIRPKGREVTKPRGGRGGVGRWMGLMLTFAWLALAGRSALALTLTPLAIEELAASADWVVRGEVLSQSCQRDSSGRIFTRVRLRVAEAWKGHPALGVIEVVHGGGVLGEERTIVSGQVEYRPGEDVVAFLVLNERKEAVTVGLSQGKFLVTPAPGAGLALVSNPFHGQTKSSPFQRATRSVESSPLTVEALRARVQGGRR